MTLLNNTSKYFLFFLIFIYLFSCNGVDNQKVEVFDLSQHVDPFIGTADHGHTYPGATVPFGMLQVSPDGGISKWDWCSGYHYTDSITIGFSHLHLSGTGIGDLYDVRLMPINKKVDISKEVKSRDDIPYKSSYVHQNENATAGYYSVFLDDPKIQVELTSDVRTAYHRYTYQSKDQQSIIVDLGFAFNWDKTMQSQLKVEDKFTVSGYRYSKGWAKNQKVFFVAKFSKSIKKYDLVSDNKYVKGVNEVKGVKTTAQLFFNDLSKDQIQVKVAVSSVSVENAKENLASEGKEFTFDKIKAKATQKWNTALSKINIETPNDSLKTIFYTALYHTQVAPVTFSDVNGQLRKENDSIVTRNFTTYSTLSLWDTFRAEHPLLTLTQPNTVTDIINSMLLYYEGKKTLPVWTLYANETNTMTGYHSIPVIAEAYFKGIKGFDINKAYEAMKTTMMQDDRGLKQYKKYGYVPYETLDESVTITLEFSYDDWCVAQVAKALGKEKDYQYFMNRSNAYQELFDPQTGFMRGKSKDGKHWHEPFDPKYSKHRIHTDYTEGNAWQHSWFVLHDTKNLIKLHGGNEKFTQKLEQLFTESSEITGDHISADISGLIGQYAHGNEPSHHIAYMFNFANKPWRTQYWVREILKTQYNASPEGLSGNEDCGQMSAWFVLSSMGLYSYNPASATYQIGSPMFKKSTIKLENGKNFVIVADNASDKNIYIQSATLNGKEFNSTTLTHQEILQGGTLHFVMGATPNKKWGIKN